MTIAQIKAELTRIDSLLTGQLSSAERLQLNGYHDSLRLALLTCEINGAYVARRFNWLSVSA